MSVLSVMLSALVTPASVWLTSGIPPWHGLYMSITGASSKYASSDGDGAKSEESEKKGSVSGVLDVEMELLARGESYGLLRALDEPGEGAQGERYPVSKDVLEGEAKLLASDES